MKSVVWRAKVVLDDCFEEFWMVAEAESTGPNGQIRRTRCHGNAYLYLRRLVLPTGCYHPDKRLTLMACTLLRCRRVKESSPFRFSFFLFLRPFFFIPTIETSGPFAIDETLLSRHLLFHTTFFPPIQKASQNFNEY